MAPKVGRKCKTNAKKTYASSSAPVKFDRVRFPKAKNEEIFENLTKYRSICGERQINLDK